MIVPYRCPRRHAQSSMPTIVGAAKSGTGADRIIRSNVSPLTGIANLCARREPGSPRSEEHTSELQSLMRISYAVFCLKQKTNEQTKTNSTYTRHTQNTSTQ